MAVDWTVALYIVIPALVYAGYNYAMWWTEAPVWAEAVPEQGWYALLYASSGFGGLRLFLNDADQLFLIRNRKWLNRLKVNGALYSSVLSAAKCMLLTMLVSPFLVKLHGAGVMTIGAAGAMTAAFGVHALFAERLLALRFSSWMYAAAKATLFSFLGALFMLAAPTGSEWGGAVAAAGLLTASSISIARIRLRLAGTFFRDVAYEQERRMRFAALLLGMVVPKASRLSRRRKPLLLNGSRRLFRKRTPDRVLAEAIVKSFLRSVTQLQLYVQFMAAGCFGLAAAQIAVKWLLLIGLSAAMAYWVRLFGKEALSSAYIQLFPWNDADKAEAIRKATPMLFVPAFALFGFLLGLTAYGWQEGVLLAPSGWFLGRAMGGIMNWRRYEPNRKSSSGKS